MATQTNFRSAFNGFNREDVVHYIEFLNSKHAADLNQLNAELEYLRNKQPEQPAPKSDDVVEQQAARIRELFDRCAALEQELEAAKAENVQLAALVHQDSVRSTQEDELEAYRRAERTERYARERAESLFRQANGVLADATVKVDEAAQQLSQMTDHIVAQLSDLQNAVSSSKHTLQDAAATLYSIRPGNDNP